MKYRVEYSNGQYPDEFDGVLLTWDKSAEVAKFDVGTTKPLKLESVADVVEIWTPEEILKREG